MKTAFIIHGFNGDTVYTFGPCLKKELENRGFNVIIPKFPIRSNAKYKTWSSIINNYIEYFNNDTIVICHSIGNPFIIKYLSENNLKINLYISVAGFCKLFTVPKREDLNEAFLDFAVTENEIEYCKRNIVHRFSLYSNNDHVVPFDVLKDFVQKMDSSPILIQGVGHMGNRDNISKLPQITKIIDDIKK